MNAVIMAGGKGTRLSGLYSNIPKPMIPILGKPILEYQIESLIKSGISDITLVVGHLKESIENHFGDGSKFGVKINYIEEDTPLGTAGALYYMKEENENFVLLFGDLMLDIDFNRFMRFHEDNNSLITLFGHPNTHPYDSDLILIDEKNCVKDIISKHKKREESYHNFVNAGVYCINPNALKEIIKPEKMDLEKVLIAGLIKAGKVFVYRSTEYVKDMGTPDRLNSVSEDVRNGVVSGRCLARKQKAVFLDRDGTINEYVGFLRSVSDFRLLPTVSEGIAKLNESAYLVIVITNQPVIARGEVTIDGLDEIHKKMETDLGNEGAYVDDVFFCPHHPDSGFEGEIKALKINCDCRKPKIGLLKKASEKYNIDLSNSWFIGDTTRDIQTGKNGGMKTVLLRTGEKETDNLFSSDPDYVADTFLIAVNYILNNTKEMYNK